jgi:hypothetical protein
VAVSLSELLSQVRGRESVGVANRLGVSPYSLPPEANVGFPNSHASGAYQFQPGTWQQLTQQSGIGTQYSQAYLAPPAVQDQVAGYAAQRNNPNSSFLWQASAPAGGYPTGPYFADANSTFAPSSGLDFSVDAASPNQLGGAGGGLDLGNNVDGTGGLGSTLNYNPLANLPFGAGTDSSTYDPFGLGQQLGAETGNLPGSNNNPIPGVANAMGGISAADNAWWQNLLTNLSDLAIRGGLGMLALVLIAAAAFAFTLGRGDFKTAAANSARFIK